MKKLADIGYFRYTVANPIIGASLLLSTTVLKDNRSYKSSIKEEYVSQRQYILVLVSSYAHAYVCKSPTIISFAYH